MTKIKIETYIIQSNQSKNRKTCSVKFKVSGY